MEAKNNSGMAKEIENFLNEYFGEDDTSIFYHRLVNPAEDNNKVELSGSKSDKAQLSKQIPIGMNEREIVNGIVTFAEQKLQKEKLLKLLMDLSELMTFNGEISIAAELCDDVISKTENEDLLRKYRADGFLSLARISWSQAYWDQSIQHVQESYDIFSSIEDKEGFARCENMLATIFGEKGDINKSLDHLEKGLLFLADSNDLALRAMFEVNLGILHNIKR